MATTRLMPLHIGKGRTVSTAIADVIDYVENPQKTDNGKLITGYASDSRRGVFIIEAAVFSANGQAARRRRDRLPPAASLQAR